MKLNVMLLSGAQVKGSEMLYFIVRQIVGLKENTMFPENFNISLMIFCKSLIFQD